jgi:hypothetical protein
MMRKSHGHDKRRCPQGRLQGRHEAAAAGLIPRNGVSWICDMVDRRYNRQAEELM